MIGKKVDLFTKSKPKIKGNDYYSRPKFYTIRSLEPNFFFPVRSADQMSLQKICQCHPNVEGPKNQESEKGHLPHSVTVTCWST